MYDLLIRDGRVVDGTGNPWFRADIAVKDGSIAAVGRIEDKAERVIDAEGLYVAPGFIDAHCHADFTVLDPGNPRDFKLRQGITTECAGQCGESAAPVNPDTLDLLKAYVAFEAPVDGGYCRGAGAPSTTTFASWSPSTCPPISFPWSATERCASTRWASRTDLRPRPSSHA